MQKFKKILVVDDDIDDQFLFANAITSLASTAECTSAKNGVEAMEFLRSSTHFDMIFLDINMPKMNGFETLKQIRKVNYYKNTPVIMISTSNEPESIKKSIELGATTYFQKPHSFPELCNGLKKLLPVA